MTLFSWYQVQSTATASLPEIEVGERGAMAYFFSNDSLALQHILYSPFYSKPKAIAPVYCTNYQTLIQRGQCILFSVVFTPSPTSHPASHHGSVWILPVISLFSTNTLSQVRAWRGFVRTKKEDESGPLIIQSSLL
jgi:hypothetical protein